MSLMTHTQPIPFRTRGLANHRSSAVGTLGSAHVAMIRRFAKLAATIGGSFLLLAAAMAVKYAAFFPRFPH